MSGETGLAQYSCDHCKHRKLRCSRELPQCANCQGVHACSYSRHGPIKRRPRSNVKKPRFTSPVSQSSTEKLVGAGAADQISQPRRNESSNNTGSEEPTETLLSDENGHTFYVGPSPTASFLTHANRYMEQLRGKFRDPRLQFNAQDSLSDLSNSFASIHFEDSSDIKKSARSLRRSNEVFFIPEAEEGQRLIRTFVASLERGKPMFSLPPLELLRKLAFEPGAVRDRGWVLLFNACLSTDISLAQPLDTKLSRGLQWNIWMLLEDSSIFLEPSEVTIQALFLLAAHGQEISTPSLCWTLVSHACRMAQTLALHLPNALAPMGSELNIHRNALFWSLFAVDKSLSLSFGRPPLLPAYLYKNVPAPEPSSMASFEPHIDRVDSDVLRTGVINETSSKGYGVVHFICVLELSKLQGEISDVLHDSSGSASSANIAKLKSKLEAWMQRTKESTSTFETLAVHPKEKKEIELGINFLNFQHDHLIVYLTRGDKENQSTCLRSARSAISLLDSLVASSTAVYNGIVWQLLYQPFMPYLAIFANIISNPHSPECFKDLQLLRQVVIYFLQMHNNHPSAKKLEKVAETFTRLAEAYVRHSMERSQANTAPAQPGFSLPTADQSSHSIPNSTNASFPSARNISANESHSDAASQTSSMPPLTDWSDPGPSVSFDDLDSDPMALLNFFSAPGMEGVSTNNFMASPENQISTNGLGEVQNSSVPDSKPLFQGLENIAQNYGLDCSFDWFSWDQYDSAMS